MAGGSSPRPSNWLVWISGLMLIAASCADPSTMPEASAAAPPVPAGQARIWLYRDWEPSESLNLANIDVNGSYFGSVANGGVFYRDVSRALPYCPPELRPRLQSRPRSRPSPGATSVLQRCVVAQLGRGWRRVGLRAGHALYPAGAARGGTDRNRPEPQWYLRVRRARGVAARRRRAVELRCKTAPTRINGDAERV
jgi:hypothetical protein